MMLCWYNKLNDIIEWEGMFFNVFHIKIGVSQNGYGLVESLICL